MSALDNRKGIWDGGLTSSTCKLAVVAGSDQGVIIIFLIEVQWFTGIWYIPHNG